MKTNTNNGLELPAGAASWLAGVLDTPRERILGRPLPVEASTRTFFRVHTDHAGSRVLMVSPPATEHNDQFTLLAGILGDAGVPVPRIVATEPDRGLFLLTDLGDRDLESIYGTADEAAALTAAIDALLELQNVADPRIPPYREDRFRDELGIFVEWFLGRLLELETPAWTKVPFEALVARMHDQPQCCVHRDYHCRNLLFNDGRLGIVDFQDALIGPASYDLASLLHDCYHSFSPAAVDRWRRYYLSQSRQRSALELDPGHFAVDLEYAAVQRQLKAIGIFTRLHFRDGKSGHLAHIEPVLGRCARLAANHAELAELGQWLATLRPGPHLARLT